MRDILNGLRCLEKQGEDNIWRTAKEAREEIERLRGALRMIESQAVLIGVNECSRLAKDALTDKPGKIVCPNCDSTMPDGCGGIFSNEGKACWLNK